MRFSSRTDNLTSLRCPGRIQNITWRCSLCSVGRLVHSAHPMLQIPFSFPSTTTEANFTYLSALLNQGNWLPPISIAYKSAVETLELTVLAPNHEDYGAYFTGWDGLSQIRTSSIRYSFTMLCGKSSLRRVWRMLRRFRRWLRLPSPHGLVAEVLMDLRFFSTARFSWHAITSLPMRGGKRR